MKTHFKLVIWSAAAFCIYIAINYDFSEPDYRTVLERARAKQAQMATGLHCLSRLDGAHRQFVEAVKPLLRDPSSFDHHKTQVTSAIGGIHDIQMHFGARNGFGGVARSVAVGSYRQSDCSVTRVQIYPDE
ncbi:hypothetical protein P7L78_22120 [Tistrella bauzanensis]|uniref:hypothetical protein n=1 Tax=Tistrella TaxID=171436 RepID=UPI0031F69874